MSRKKKAQKKTKEPIPLDWHRLLSSRFTTITQLFLWVSTYLSIVTRIYNCFHLQFLSISTEISSLNADNHPFNKMAKNINLIEVIIKTKKLIETLFQCSSFLEGRKSSKLSQDSIRRRPTLSRPASSVWGMRWRGSYTSRLSRNFSTFLLSISMRSILFLFFIPPNHSLLTCLTCLQSTGSLFSSTQTNASRLQDTHLLFFCGPKDMFQLQHNWIISAFQRVSHDQHVWWNPYDVIEIKMSASQSQCILVCN